MVTSTACRPPARSRFALGASRLKELVLYWMSGWAVTHCLVSRMLIAIRSSAVGEVCAIALRPSTSSLGNPRAYLDTRCASEACGKNDMDLGAFRVETCNVPSPRVAASTMPTLPRWMHLTLRVAVPRTAPGWFGPRSHPTIFLHVNSS